jgi:hypothetical protein
VEVAEAGACLELILPEVAAFDVVDLGVGVAAVEGCELAPRINIVAVKPTRVRETTRLALQVIIITSNLREC